MARLEQYEMLLENAATLARKQRDNADQMARVLESHAAISKFGI